MSDPTPAPASGLRAALDTAVELHERFEGATCGTCADADGQAAAWPCETAAALVVARQVLGTMECTCGTPGVGNYEGPQEDCPEHGVRPAPADRAALRNVRPHTLASIACHLDARSVAILRPESETYAEWQAVAADLRVLADGAAAGVQQPATERRERYATAVDNVGFIGDAFPAVLDAVMAVADEEQRNLRESLRKARRAADLLAGSHQEAERLRARLQLVTAETVADVAGPNIELLCEENARLRGELGQARAATFTEAADEAASHAEFHGGKTGAGGRALLYLAKALRQAAARPGDRADTEAVHAGGNAEDCPACEGTNPPYPFLCPGTAPAVRVSPEEPQP